MTSQPDAVEADPGGGPASQSVIGARIENSPARPIEHQQPRGFALFDGRLRNSLVGQHEVILIEDLERVFTAGVFRHGLPALVASSSSSASDWEIASSEKSISLKNSF